MGTARALFLLSIIIVIVVIPSGADAGWVENGAPVIIYGGHQDQVRICPDGLGGAIITWRDRRSISNIYAQRLDEMGRRQWTVFGVLVCGGDDTQEQPRIISDGNGGAIIVWQDHRYGTPADIYAMRINAAGTMMWAADGIAVCQAVNEQTEPMLCPDGAGGCIIAWEDERTSIARDIYAQRIDADGNVLWTADGVLVCGADGVQERVELISDGSGGAFLVWEDKRDIGDIYAQHLNSSGVAQWADGILLIGDTYAQAHPQVVTDGAGGFYVSLYNTMQRAYIQRVSADGTLLFTGAGVLLGHNSPYYSNPKMVADGIGGAIIVWQSWRDSDHYEAYAQRVDRSGTLLWGMDGAAVNASGGSTYGLGIICDGVRGAIISWRDTRNILTTSNDIFVQKLDSLGVAQWLTDGDSVCTADGSQALPVITTDGAGGAIVTWVDARIPDYDLYAMRILSDGDYVATALAGFTAVPALEGVGIEWAMSSMDPGVSFRVLRALSVTGCPDAGSLFFEEIAVIVADMDEMEYSFKDTGAESGNCYVYRVEIVTAGSDDTMLLFETDAIGLPPTSLRLAQNVPNPFNPATTVSFFLPSRAGVRLDVFDVSGKFVATLVDEVRGSGSSEVSWNGTNASGENVSSGIYFYRLTAGKETISRKMILLR